MAPFWGKKTLFFSGISNDITTIRKWGNMYTQQTKSWKFPLFLCYWELSRGVSDNMMRLCAGGFPSFCVTLTHHSYSKLSNVITCNPVDYGLHLSSHWSCSRCHSDCDLGMILVQVLVQDASEDGWLDFDFLLRWWNCRNCKKVYYKLPTKSFLSF